MPTQNQIGQQNRSCPRIGYGPYNRSLTAPGDKRRFVAYARARNLPFEMARPDERYDLVVLTELADISIWPEYRHGKIVYDLVDSYLAIPRTDFKQMLRGIWWFASGRHRHLQLDFKGAIARMCRRADAVVCTTEEQQHDIMAFCPNVHVVLDIQDDIAPFKKPDYRAGSPFNLVWEGLPSNLPHLKIIGPALRQLSRHTPLILNIVTAAKRPLLFDRFGSIKSIDVAKRIFDRVAFHQWDAATWSGIVTGCDAAVIPIDLNNPLSVGKPANKLLVFWRTGMPVVTSATPAYMRALRAAGLEHLACKDESDWLAALDRLIKSEADRRDAGDRGYAYVAEHFTTDALLALWDNVFSSIGFDFGNIAP